MSMKYLGEHFDIHGGGTELIFPHHENEVAQSEAATGKPYVNHWVHHGLVNLTGEKMSKSTGHFRTMAEISSRFPADVVRFYLLSTYYRSEIEFSEERLVEAGAAVERFENLFRTLATDRGRRRGRGRKRPAPSPAVAEARGRFLEAMDDDLNTAQAIGHLFDLVRVLNQEVEQAADPAALRADRAVLRELLGVLGLLEGVRGRGRHRSRRTSRNCFEERTASPAGEGLGAGGRHPRRGREGGVRDRGHAARRGRAAS